MRVTFKQREDSILTAQGCHSLIQHMDVDFAKNNRKQRNNNTTTRLNKSNKSIRISESDSEDAALEYDFGVGASHSSDSQRVCVDAPSNDDGDVIVGEDLFMQMCDAWLQTHGNEAIIKALQKHKQLIQDAVVVAIKTNKVNTKM